MVDMEGWEGGIVELGVSEVLMKQFRIILVLALVLGMAGMAASDLGQTIEQAFSNPGFAHGIQGIIVESLKDGRVLYEKNSNLVFMPASNMKLIVSSASLDLLGKDYVIPTSLYLTGEVSDGTLKGDVILAGQGDPTLKDENLEEMAAKLKSMGIKRIEGNIIADDTYFDSVRLGSGWSWDYQSDYYAAQISAINLNQNVVGVYVRPGKKVGKPAVIELLPQTRYMKIENECKTSETGATKGIFMNRIMGTNTIRIGGNVALDYKPTGPEDGVTVDDPALFACTVFSEILKRDGIRLRGKVLHGTAPTDAKPMFVHNSPPMSQILKLLNKPSDNLIAECLLKQLGARLNGKGSADSGGKVEMGYLEKIGADTTGINISDGSGLSRYNVVSPKNLLAVLKYMHGHKDSQVFFESLPIAGVDGTLKGRLKDTAAEGNVHAKTGYIGMVRALSGYVTTESGEPLVFSILMNNHLCPRSEADAAIDTIVIALANITTN